MYKKALNILTHFNSIIVKIMELGALPHPPHKLTVGGLEDNPLVKYTIISVFSKISETDEKYRKMLMTKNQLFSW